jgi:hypothetical protein
MKKLTPFLTGLLVSVLIMSHSNSTIAQTQSTLLHETFDHPVGTLPPGWTVIGDGATNWGIYNASSAGGATPEMRFNWSPSFVGESRLVTPALNAGNKTALRLKLNIFFRYYDLSHTIRIGYSTDGGAIWTDFWEQICNSDYGPQLDEHYFTVPANADFHLGFYYSGDSYNIWDWNLDDIMVELLLDYDLAGVSVAGNAWPVVGEPSDYTVSIQNLGSQPVLGSAYTVNLFREGGFLVGQVPGIDITPTSFESFDFTWIPEATGSTWLYAYVDFPTDEFMGNNSTPNLNVVVQQGEILEVVIGTGTETSGSIPISPWWGYSFSQTIYLQSEINQANKRINRIGYQYAEGTPVLDEITEIWIAHTNLTQLDAVVQMTDATKVYDGPFVFTVAEDFSWVDIDPYFYNNTDNLLVTIIEKKPGWNSSSDVFYVTPLEAGQPVMSHFARNDNNPYDPLNLPAGTSISSRANIKLWLSATPDDPEIKVTPESLDFGEVELTVIKTLPVTVQNIGGGILEITGANFTNDNFSLSGASFPVMLETGEQHIFDVQFHPSEPQTETGELTFLTGAGVPGNKTIQLTGRGMRFGILREGFENEFFPSLGWIVIDNNSDGDTWFRNVNTVPTGQVAPRTGIAAAGLPPYAGNWGQTAYDDWLITPKMIWQDGDLFEFWIKRVANQTGQIWRIKLSTTGTNINDFTTTIENITDPPLSYTLKSYDLSQHGLTDSTEFYIAFQFNGVWSWPGVIDDVTGSVLVRYDYDLLMMDFTGNDIIYENATNDYVVMFGNYGNYEVLAADYTIKICAVINGQEIVFATAPGQGIEPGQVKSVTVPVTIPDLGEYGLYAKIDFAGDEDPTNNISDIIDVEVISNSIILKHVGAYPINPETDYTVYYPVNFDDYRGASLHECLYYTSELNTGGIITRLTYYTSFANPIPNRKVKVWMVQTNLANLETSAIPADDMKLVFDGTLNFDEGLGKININLTEPFIYTSSANLAVLVYYYQGGNPYINNTSKFAYQYVESGPTRNVYDNWFTTVDPNNLENVFRTQNFPVTSLMFETGNGLGSITGRVLLQDGGAPVEGARVIIENADFPGHYAEIYTNATGYYNAPFMLAGSNLTLTISKYGYSDVVYEGVNLAPGGSVNLGDAFLVPRPVIALSGNIITSDTQLPAVGAVVKLFGIDDYETISDDNGNFAFAEIWGSTTYQIRITLEGYQAYIADVEVPAIDYQLDLITILELAPAPNLVTVTEMDANSLVTWYAAGAPYPYEFRYDDGTLNGVLITTGTPDVVVGSAWKHHALINQVQWYTHNHASYPFSPQVLITILGLTDAGAPDPDNVIHTQANVQNKAGWNTFDLPNTVEAPNGFFFGISGYSNYTVIPYDDGLGEPYEWQPLTQWSNGMGSYQPLENVTAPPLHANIFMRAAGLTYGQLDTGTLALDKTFVPDTFTGSNPMILEAVEPVFAGDPETSHLSWPAITAFNHYNVYRKNMLDDEWMQINESPVNDTSYIDNGWVNLPAGSYQYAVEAEYSNGVTSEPALSNIIEKTVVPILPGDANCDGTVDVLDIIVIANFIMDQNPSPFCYENADVNGDGLIDVLDIILTANIIIGGQLFEAPE